MLSSDLDLRAQITSLYTHMHGNALKSVLDRLVFFSVGVATGKEGEGWAAHRRA
jgi:hypothetical protein